MALGMGLSQALARFARTAQPAASARDVMRLSLLDWAACGIAGAQEPVSQAVRMTEAEAGGAEQASAVGLARRLPVRGAALLNAAASHALDYDDTHFAHIGHVSVAVLPAALAAAERAGGVPCGELLDAALVGAETATRVGLWLGRRHYQAGFHQTSTAGAFGATVAAGRLMRLPEESLVCALGIAATRASGLKVQFGTMGKPLNAGFAAAAGVESALLSASGLVSRPDALEAEGGFGATHAGEANLDAALRDLGKVWLFEGVSHKFHACCHGLHAMLEALREIRVAPDRVARVIVRTSPRWKGVCDLPSPRTGLEAKFSYQLTAAMALAGRSTSALDTFTDAACADPLLVALRDRVEVAFAEELEETVSRVEVLDAAGAVHVAEANSAAALPFADRRSRVVDKAAALLGAERARALWTALSDDTQADQTIPMLTAMLRAA